MNSQSQSQSQSQTQSPPPVPPKPNWLRVRHDTIYDYDTPVELAHHLACLSPRNTANQQVRNWTLLIDPVPDAWAPLKGGVGGHESPQCRLSLDDVLLLEICVRCFVGRDPQAAIHLQIPSRFHVFGKIGPLLNLVEVMHRQFTVTEAMQAIDSSSGRRSISIPATLQPC